MRNLCSIFHARFKRLRELIPNARSAQLMDYILLGWQNSNYKLKDSDQKWFMKEYSKIVDETGIALSTLKRYLKEFEEEGLIERRQALYSRNSETGFDCKKGCYISITSKFIFLLNDKNQNFSIATSLNTNEVQEKPVEQLLNNKSSITSNVDNIVNNSENFNQNETFEKLDLSCSNIRDLYLSIDNNIRDFNFLKNVDKNELPKVKSYLNAFEKTLFNDIKEEIPDEIKHLVLGTFINLVVKHKITLSSPEQVVAEYLFALINTEFFIKNIDCIKHRNNILAKLLRTNQWQTPKGFYNYFYLGKNFKDKNDIREKGWEESKSLEIKGLPDSEYMPEEILIDENKHPKLREIEKKISIIYNSIENIEKNLYADKNLDIIEMKSKKLEQLNTVLFKLYDEQNEIEAELELPLEIKDFPDSNYMSEEELIDDNKHSKLMEIENKISIINNSIVNLEKNLFSEKNIDSINANFKMLEELKKQLSKLLNQRHQIKLIQSEVA